MLTINLSATDSQPAFKLTMEHSLLALSKWESITQKAFFGRGEKTPEEMILYIECMILDEDYPPDFLERFKKSDYTKISDHINANKTATTFLDDQKKMAPEIITSELIYYWLVQFRIPFQPTETWHLSRVFTLVQVCGRKQEKPKKMSKQALAQKYREINEQRRRDMGTSG